jgi:hypothetical protein
MKCPADVEPTLIHCDWLAVSAGEEAGTLPMAMLPGEQLEGVGWGIPEALALDDAPRQYDPEITPHADGAASVIRRKNAIVEPFGE